MARSTSSCPVEHASLHMLRNAAVATLLAVAWIALLLGASQLLKQFAGSSPGQLTMAVRGTAQPTAAHVPHNDPTERLRGQIVGTWRDHYQGERTMTVRDDGTATMVVVFRGMKARLFTPRLELEMAWSVRNGHMTRRTTGGTPPDKVDFVNRYAGRQVSEKILKLTSRQLILLDQDGSTRYNWQRLAVR
jgi:hypothetical protein